MSIDSIRLQPRGRGPYIIIGRPHSGSRLLAGLCMANGLFLGSDLTHPFLDSWSWYQRFTVPLLTSQYFPDWETHFSNAGLLAFCHERIEDSWPRYWNNAGERWAWGWKYCESLFVMPLLKRCFPAARFIHIIRDGRDVCLSDGGFFQLTGRHENPRGWDPPLIEGKQPSFYDFCRAVTFGKRIGTEWRGLSLNDREVLVANRFLVQAQSWRTCVTRAREYGDLFREDYFEIRYEDLCSNPCSEMRRLFDWMALPLRAGTWNELDRVSSSQIGKWRRQPLTISERRDFGRAVELAQELLAELGYDSA